MTIKHFGTHLYSPIKPKGKRNIKYIIAPNPIKKSQAKGHIFSTIIFKDGSFEDIENKAWQFIERKIMNQNKSRRQSPSLSN